MMDQQEQNRAEQNGAGGAPEGGPAGQSGGWGAYPPGYGAYNGSQYGYYDGPGGAYGPNGGAPDPNGGINSGAQYGGAQGYSGAQGGYEYPYGAYGYAQPVYGAPYTPPPYTQGTAHSTAGGTAGGTPYVYDAAAYGYGADGAAYEENGGAQYAYGSGAGAPAKRRKNFAPLVTALLCLGLAATVFLLGAASDAVRDSGARPVRPTPGAVPSFTIEDLPETADGGLTTAEIAQKVNASVVCVNIYEENSLSVSGMGSGVIFNKDGFIVTNAHVVEGAAVITVQLDDGRELDAWTVGADARSDLAVIKVDAGEDLVPASFGNSDALQLGERVVAIGNAAGLFSNTVTQGVISGLDREVQVETDSGVLTMHLIQTDAAINPGNSGGALVNRFGQVIGISSSKMNSSRYEGLGFAIPAADAQPIVGDLIDYGYVKDRVSLGVMVIALTPATGPSNGLPSQGLYISEVMSYSDLNNHDITAGDVILTADGVLLETTSDLLDVLETHKPGETVTLEIQKRGSGRVVTVDAVLAEARSNS